MKTIKFLEKYWGYTGFRALQQPIIDSVLERNDTLALLPTGGGKSICYQLPSLMLPGITLVISPLIALMKDQVDGLKKKGISAEAIYSGMRYPDIDRILDNCIYGEVQLLYLSPERIQSRLADERIKQMEVSLIAVDEAHCISQWGYDFRPSYLEIASLREYFPQTPILALTATATTTVQQDIQEKLLFRTDKSQVFKASFQRSNLSFSSEYTAIKESRLLELLQKNPGASIIYVRSRGKTAKVSNFLNYRGFDSDFYHAGLRSKIRQEKQEQWANSENKIMVCTNAFGMGLDKSNVRTVIHLDIPQSMEAYYQEAGRAGRDGVASKAILLWNDQDITRLKKQEQQQFPPVETIKSVYHLLASHFHIAFGDGEHQDHRLNLTELGKRFDGDLNTLYYCLQWLEKNELIRLNEFSSLGDTIHIPRPAMIYRKTTPLQKQIVKTIFRIHEGVQIHPVSLQTEKVLQWLPIDRKALFIELDKLNAYDYLFYEKDHHQPTVTFLHNRLTKDQLRLDVPTYRRLKERHQSRVEKMVGYLKSEQCLQNYILEYFDEHHDQPCGRCSNCIQKTWSPQTVREVLLAELKQGPQDIKILLEMFPSKIQEKVLNELTRMIDDKVLDTDRKKIWLCQ